MGTDKNVIKVKRFIGDHYVKIEEGDSEGEMEINGLPEDSDRYVEGDEGRSKE